METGSRPAFRPGGKGFVAEEFLDVDHCRALLARFGYQCFKKLADEMIDRRIPIQRDLPRSANQILIHG